MVNPCESRRLLFHLIIIVFIYPNKDKRKNETKMF